MIHTDFFFPGFELIFSEKKELTILALIFLLLFFSSLHSADVTKTGRKKEFWFSKKERLDMSDTKRKSCEQKRVEE